MTSALRVLLLEDDAKDAELVQELLESDHPACEVTWVQTRAEFLAALEDNRLDLILADYKLPAFDGISALGLAQKTRPDLPFIFVSGSLGEEVAIEALKYGATDYVLKTRLSRLLPSVERALREARERAERKRAEEALRQSEMYLAEAQRLSHTGSCGWNLSTGEIFWSDETYRIFDCEPTTKPTVALVIDRTHPDDRMRVRDIVDRAPTEMSSFSLEHRITMSDGSIKHVRVVAHRARGEGPDSLLFVGAVTDVTDRKRAEEERQRLCQLEADLARINRVSMMGELAASLGHEIKQPITALSINARVCLRRLEREPPDIEAARGSVSKILDDIDRINGIIDRNRLLYGLGAPQRERVDLNEIIERMAALLQDAANRHSVSIHTDLDEALPAVMADPVQLQQVLMNLMLNGIEAIKDESGTLSVASGRAEDCQLLISVSDSGGGLPDEPERVFEAFFTTKPQGTGMGLSISRRIIELHGGRLWASPNAERGATFRFTLPHE